MNLAYPFMGQVLIGATDIKIDDPDAAMCDDDEADYLRGVVAEIFPDIPVTADQIRHRFSGVRPLPRANGDIGSVTRDHSIAELTAPGGAPVLCLIGGKWTTFRGFSEQVTNRILQLIGRTRQRTTSDMQIGGGAGYPAPDQRHRWIETHAHDTGVPADRISTLLRRYGTRAARIAAHLGEDRPLASLPDYSREELSWLIQHEQVGHLDDLLNRRTTIAISGALTPEVRREIGALYEQSRSAIVAA